MDNCTAFALDKNTMDRLQRYANRSGWQAIDIAIEAVSEYLDEHEDEPEYRAQIDNVIAFPLVSATV